MSLLSYTDIKPPGGVKPEEFDGFHELVLVDELSRCGSGGVVGGLMGGTLTSNRNLLLDNVNQ